MPWIDYPTIKLETDLGPVEAAFTNGGHVSVSTNAHVNDTAPAITYRGADYLVHVHLHAEQDWNARTDRGYLSVTRRDTFKDAPPTYRAAIVEALVKAVREFVAANPDVLRQAEYADAHNDAERDAATLAKLEDEAEQVRTHLAANRQRMADNAPPD